MNNTTIEVSLDDLQLIHQAMDRVNAVNRLYNELMMTGLQAQQLQPWTLSDTRGLTHLRDRVAEVIIEANPELPNEVGDELFEVHLQPLRKSKRPSFLD